MNLTIQMTLDGLVRALRWKAHDLAEDVEQRYFQSGTEDLRQEPAGRAAGTREDSDDRSGR